jgi:hypothetical protein
MAKQQEGAGGSWLLAEELLERGDPAFVDELRRIHDPDRLGAFASKWFADKRPASRELMFQYLAQPLNAFRHEALVKRLFKLAEKADDEVLMAHFLAAFDRSVRRVVRKRRRYDWQSRETWVEESLRVPADTAMPRGQRAMRYRNPRTGEPMAGRTPEKNALLRLFSLNTRQYLRRRAWRYFRRLGKEQPARYVPAIVAAMKQYTDDDVADGVALLDNWGLVHALFHQCPALVATPRSWGLAEGHTLAELTAAPIYESLWKAAPAKTVEVLREAHCRPVRQWAVQMIRRHYPEALAVLPLRELVAMLGHDDPELSQLAAEALRHSPELGRMPVQAWLKLLESANPQILDLLCELMLERLDPQTLNLEQTVGLACSRPLPVARMGFTWLKKKTPASPDECRTILALAEAEAEPLRAEMVRWARSVLTGSPHFQVDWVLELLDGRHEDVRREAWAWFMAEPRAAGEIMLWQRLLESPYDDIRLRLATLLEEHAAREVAIDRARLDAELIRFLWASVLLNAHRGSRVKPLVIRQIVGRLEHDENEAPQLLPILAVALRSVRKPEWRAGLAGIVQLVERRPELEPLVQASFPELRLGVL